MLHIDCYYARIDEKGNGHFRVTDQSSRDKLARFGIYYKELVMKPPYATADTMGHDVVVVVSPTYYEYMKNGKKVTGMRPVASSIKLKNVSATT